MKKIKGAVIEVHGTTVSVLSGKEGDYISLTDMLKAKDGDFFIADWLRNRNTVEFLGIWESVFNPGFNHGEFATIKSQAGLNSYKLSFKEWVAKTHANIEGMNAEFIHMELVQGERLKRLNQIAIRQMRTLTAPATAPRLEAPKAGGMP